MASKSSTPHPGTPKGKAELSVKQQRDARRAEKVEALRKQQAKAKRNRLVGIITGSVAAAAAVALVITFVVQNQVPRVDPDDITVAGLETFSDLDSTHVTTAVDYETDYGMTPPAGGSHAQVWLNCGIYEQQVPNENATHALEHGAVWVTYDPDALSEAEVETLRDEMPSSYIILSPYADLPAPVVASGWGTQVFLDGVDDPRLSDFITKYRQSADVPEPGALCTGGVDGEGKIA